MRNRSGNREKRPKCFKVVDRFACEQTATWPQLPTLDFGRSPAA